MIVKTKIKDFLFVRHFIVNNIADRSNDLAAKLLDTDVLIATDGEPDQVINRGTEIEIINPSSITRCLFSILDAVVKSLETDINADYGSLALLFMCKNYVYADFQHKNNPRPPVIIKTNKLPVVNFLVRDIVEPLTQKIEMGQTLFMPCRFTDACRWMESDDQLFRQYSFPKYSFDNYEFPLLLSNFSIYNKAAVTVDIFIKTIERSLGETSAQKVIKHIILDPSVLDMVLLVLKTLNTEPEFTLDFLQYLSSYCAMNSSENEQWADNQQKHIAQDAYLKSFIKEASDGYHTPDVFKQWSQWSMLSGLIEKQLSPARGSAWPTSEKMKPHENKLKLIFMETQKRKKKNTLNMEEMLEACREMYNKKATEPGSLIETVLKDNRIWKH